MFQSLSEKLENAFKKFKNKGKLTEADVKAGMREIKLALLEDADALLTLAKETNAPKAVCDSIAQLKKRIEQ